LKTVYLSPGAGVNAAVHVDALQIETAIVQRSPLRRMSHSGWYSSWPQPRCPAVAWSFCLRCH